ncbi:hypothetical protein N9Y42_10695 [Mariniblastus sp.]|nr:hypothetical protein [Mariniblastus sp.]
MIKISNSKFIVYAHAKVFWQNPSKFKTQMSNPYESPSLRGEVSRPPISNAVRRIWSWPVVFALNLPIAVLLGRHFLNPSSIIGVAAIVALLFLAGLMVCWRFPLIGQSLIIGSLLTAISQLLPILHLVLGMIALSSAQDLGLVSDNPDSNDGFVRFLLPSIASGAWVALVVGSGIAVCALSIGGILRAIFAKWLAKP